MTYKYEQNSSALFEDNLEKVFSMYQDLGVKAVKTGYAGGIHTKGQFHHGQFMVKHYRKVVETAAKYQIMVKLFLVLL